MWLTFPPGRSARSRSLPGVEHRVAALPAHHVTTGPTGIAVTTPARTAADLCRGLPLTEALQLLDACLRRESRELMPHGRRRDLANPRLLGAASRGLREAAGSLPRMAAVRAALPLANPLRDSPVASLSFAHMALAGLPLPACQVAIATSVGVYFPDFYWEAQNLIGEVDGRIKYEDAAAIVHEKEREQVLRDLGFRMVRWLGKEIHARPDLVLARIDRALRA